MNPVQNPGTEKETRCHECWEYGHVKANCEGPESTDFCIKCCQKGQKADKCLNKPVCIRYKKRVTKLEVKDAKSTKKVEMKWKY